MCTQCRSLQDSRLSSLARRSRVATNDSLLEILYEWLMLAAAALHCNTGHSYNGQCTAECRLQGDWRKWPSSPVVNKHIGRPICCPYHRRAWRPNERFQRRSPQPKSNLVHFSFKICCLVAAVSMIFMRINWPKFIFLKLILMTIISSCSLSSRPIKAQRDHVFFCSNFSSGPPFLRHSLLTTDIKSLRIMYCDVNLPLWITYNNFTYVVSLFL